MSPFNPYTLRRTGLSSRRNPEPGRRVFAVGQFAADADHEDRPVFAGRFRLAFPRRQRRIHFQQVFALDEPDGLRKDRRDVRIDLIHFAFHAANYTVNFSNDLFQEIEVALFGRHGAFPIPLIHVDRMQVIQALRRRGWRSCRYKDRNRERCRKLRAFIRFHLASECTTSARRSPISLIGNETGRSTPFRSSLIPVPDSTKAAR